MKLNKLENKFFDQVINVELDVPVHATLKYEGATFKVIAVPEITPEGYFILKYFNAPPYEPELQVSDDGTSYTELTREEAYGQHPLLERAWRERATVELQLNPSNLPMQPEPNPTLRAKVQYADVGHRGVLLLEDEQVTLSTSSLKKADFSISALSDFERPSTPLASIAGISESDRQTLRNIGDKLGDGASLIIRPSPCRVVLDTESGWKITLTRDKDDTAEVVSHSGVVERNDGGDFRVKELRDTLEGLRYFFAFTMVNYCFPSVIIGYDANERVAWGEAGEFRSDRQPGLNWFNHPGDVPSGSILERFFPKFWRKWATHRDEIIAVIDCYVSSESMRRAGVLRDSVAKSCAGLEVMAGLVLGKTILGNTKDPIDKALRCCRIPHRHLDNSENPVTHKLCSDLNITDGRGASLLVDIRNYIVHPLDEDTVIKREHLQYVDGDMRQYVYLHDLSQFYLEYMLLWFCDHYVSEYRQLRENEH